MAGIAVPKIVLVETSHPGNIGGVARAMKTMGHDRLVLVNPKTFPSQHALEMASGATDILQQAVVVDTLIEAVADCQLVVGTSARSRQLSLPCLSPRALPEWLLKSGVDVNAAVVFGNERTGLTNQQISLCHCQVVIPTSPDYSSLNLAQAVQIICYELFHQGLRACGQTSNEADRATMGDVDALMGHLQASLVESGFLDLKHPKRIMPKLKRLFQRAHLEVNEVDLLRGIITSFQKMKQG